MRRVVLVGVLLFGLSACGSDEPAPATAADRSDVYVAYLEKEGIVPTYGDAEMALTLGHQLCDRYERGDNFVAVIKTLTNNNIPAREAGQINGAATAAFCPEHATN